MPRRARRERLARLIHEHRREFAQTPGWQGAATIWPEAACLVVEDRNRRRNAAGMVFRRSQ
jgi:hypothetical protein